ncbi:hypothetical protein BRADI_4g00245v3 [Brachypodium distachyon]|uniref:Protein kinase domain-containing protein n=1 Tax=Brachypodium distachyon TaxID=15368 RepID=A0A2K2CJP2_BRADI|nr:hypothetical protein BRADI_4g00245v3 [Brachypodium distachyon]
MGCSSCFGLFTKRRESPSQSRDSDGFLSDDPLICQDDYGHDGEDADFPFESDTRPRRSVKRAQEIIMSRAQSGFDEEGNKMVNEYVHLWKIGSGSYGKVVLYRNTEDGKLYALKVLHKSYMKKVRVAPSETAMSDVLREVSIMKMLDHPKYSKSH